MGLKFNCKEEEISGRNFRQSLRNPQPKHRTVPAFTIQALQVNTRVVPPPRINFLKEITPKKTIFRTLYDDGELPIKLSGSKEAPFKWKEAIECIDYHNILPVFFEGLQERGYPYSFLAVEGIKDLLSKGGHRVLPVVPQLILPIRKAMITKNKAIISKVLRIIQYLAMSGDMVGEALVPYYRQILPIMNVFVMDNHNLWEGIDVDKDTLGDLIRDTLNILEKYGGEDAFINIKYMVPTYESYTMN